MATKSTRNKTMEISSKEKKSFDLLLDKAAKTLGKNINNQIINADILQVAHKLPHQSIDLAVIDPPYNLNKDFKTVKFKKSSDDAFADYTDSWIQAIRPLLKDQASLYVCCDWQSSSAVYSVLKKYFTVRSRITWQREKGRGALNNWKNCHEDIWYCTVSDDFYFDVDSVKQKRKVIAPYRENGQPKDWEDAEDGQWRLTYPSNFWDDITIPFWSMPENTPHPTQKPEKLLAKLILASSKPNDLIFDCFLGSGSTATTAYKLGRKYLGIEIDREWCYYALKRLTGASVDKRIQGYENGVFWERNSLSSQPKTSSLKQTHEQPSLFTKESTFNRELVT